MAELSFFTLASGSSGNCMSITFGSAHILIDAGISCRRITTALKAHHIVPSEINAILVTHEHSDHISGLQNLLKSTAAVIYTSSATAQQLENRIDGVGDRICSVNAGNPFFVEEAEIVPFETSHDAAGSLGFRVNCGGKSISLATDTGYVTSDARKIIPGSDFVLLEANYDREMLLSGPYPYQLKQRILGNKGHLQNEESAAFAIQLAAGGTKHIVLGHLSKENNTPELAMKAVRSALAEAGYADRVCLQVAPRSECSEVWYL